MKKIIICIIMLSCGLISSAQNNIELFPKFSDFSSETNRIVEFNKSDFKTKEGSFLNLNPTYFYDGKYFYVDYDKKFNYTEYPSTNTISKNNLTNFKSVQVVFSGYLFSHPYECFSRGYIEDKSFKNYGFYSESNNKLSAKSLYISLNDFYKKEIENILLDKENSSFFIADLLDNKIKLNNDISKDLILKLNIENLKEYLGGSKWPGYVQYSMDVIDIKAEKIKTYKQVFFFRQKIGARMAVKFGESIEIVGKTIGPAFSCMLNQFLNDNETQQILKEKNNQKDLELDKNYAELNKIQYELLNITLEKYNIAKELSFLGVGLENIKEQNDNYIDPKSINAINNIKGDPTISAGNNLLAGFFNALDTGTDQRYIADKEQKVNYLQTQLEKLDIKRKEIIFSISDNLLSSNLNKYLPKTKEVNDLVNEATINFKEKSNNAIKNIESRTKNKKNKRSGWNLDTSE